MRFMKHHSKNQDTPYLAGGITISVCSIVSIVLFGASWIQYIGNSSNHFAAVMSAVLVDLANSDRTALAPDAKTLTVNSELVAAAQAKANNMALKGYFAHIDPDGKEPWAWIKEAGYDYQYAGENLAVRFGDSIEVERAWLASPTHRANLLDGRFTEVGIATAYGIYQGQPTTFVVQMFGTSKKAIAAAAKPPPPQLIAQTEPAREIAMQDKPVVLGAVDVAKAATITVEPYVPEASRVEHFMASPKTYARYGYAILALVVLITGGYALYFEMRQRHFRHGAYAVALSFSLITFLYITDAIIFAGPVVARLSFPIAS